MNSQDHTTNLAKPALDVEQLLGQLTLDEKIALLDGADMWRTKAVDRLGIRQIMVADGPHGLRAQSTEGDHLGALAAEKAVAFPIAAATASSWNTELLHRIGVALAEESRAHGVSVLLGPGVNMKRSPLCGRNFEYFSEDPFLAGELAAAFVDGVQSQGVGTSIKHFAANNQETDRLAVSAEVDERTLREIYFPAFETVVKRCQPWTVMCSYNRINGVFASEDPWLLTKVLREDWGFEGLVVSDWGAVADRDKAVAAGLDLEMPSSGGVGAKRVAAAIEDGTLSLDELDSSVRRVLHLVSRSQATSALSGWDERAHHELAREAAAEGIVLLKNNGGALPLSVKGGKVAVIGEFARFPRYGGGGSSQVTPTRLDDAWTALKRSLPGRELAFTPGFTLSDDTSESEARALKDQAVRLASESEVAVVFIGLPGSYESEGYDRDHMTLPAQQIAVLEAVAEAAPCVVAVLTNGSAVETEAWGQQVSALMEAWLPGQAGGTAVAEVLTGAVNPSGKLAETFPLLEEHNPAHGNFPGDGDIVRYGEGLLIGYRWYDSHRFDVAYPFGHGLSYTSFKYSDLEIEVLQHGDEPRARVRFTLTNTGDRFGKEVAQVYVTDEESGVFRPERELKGFVKVALDPGSSARIEIDLDARAFSYWHPRLRNWVAEPGAFTITVGASSRDLRLSSTVTIQGEPIRLPLEADSPAGDWLNHPEVGPRIHEALTGTRTGDMLMSPDVGRMIRAVPMRRLSRFPGSPLTEEWLEEQAAGLHPGS